MGLLSKIFRSHKEVLPTLDELLKERQIELEETALEPFEHVFQELTTSADRLAWADALASLIHRNEPLPPSWLDLRDEIQPQLCPRWVVEKHPRWSQILTNDLLLCARYKNQPIPLEWLTLLGLHREDFYEHALDYLRSRSQESKFERLESGVYQSAYGDGLDACRILLPDLWLNLVKPPFFVGVPSMEHFFLAPMVLLPQMVKEIQKVLATPVHHLQAAFMQYIDGKWGLANLQDPHPMAQTQRDFKLLDQSFALDTQNQDLKELMTNGELPAALFPGVSQLTTQTGRHISFSLWQEGSAIVLAEVDMLGLISSTGQPLGMFSRQTMNRVPELRGKQLDIWGPRRVFHDQFPSPEQRSQLDVFLKPEDMAQVFAKGQQQQQQQQGPPMPKGAAPASNSGFQAPSRPTHLRNAQLGNQSDED